MGYPVLKSYSILFCCSDCFEEKTIEVDVDEDFMFHTQRHTIDYTDLTDVASENDFLIDDNGKMICFNCAHKRDVEASLPTFREITM